MDMRKEFTKCCKKQGIDSKVYGQRSLELFMHMFCHGYAYGTTVQEERIKNIARYCKQNGGSNGKKETRQEEKV